MSLGHNRRHRLRQIAHRFINSLPDLKDKDQHTATLYSILTGVDSYARQDKAVIRNLHTRVGQSGRTHAETTEETEEGKR